MPPDSRGQQVPPEVAEEGEVAVATNSTAVSASGGPGWVVEMWVDPEWYDSQEADDPMPAPTAPVVVPLTKMSVLVGRPSASRRISPDVDAGADSGVSRRHCQFSTDGHRWWVEDLDSANGTYVAAVGRPLPSDPIPVGERQEITDSDRIFVGAWTRLQLRPALAGEIAIGNQPHLG
ncbi:MAG: FHA domain-containing protein [Beutenbergiaceae bacterium]